MKKLLSLLVSAAIGLTSMSAMSCSSADKTSEAQGKNIVLFGDSIAAGYSRNNTVEYNYGEICADYLGGEAANYAVSGDTTDDLIEVIAALDDTQKNTVADADYIIISAGGNDIIHYASKFILEYAAKKGFLNEGFTADMIPDEPSFTTLMLMLNINGEGGLMEYASSGFTAVSDLATQLRTLANNLRLNSGTYDGYIINHIIPGLSTAVDDIRAINPDAPIIIQTIYNPIEISPEYIAEHYGSNSDYATMIGQLRLNCENIMNTFKSELNTYAASADNVKVADVLYEFRGLDDSVTPNNANPGYAYYFTDMQSGSLQTADFHPNQKGHLAIASIILKTIGDLHDDNGLLSKIYEGLDDKDDYPEIPLATYKEVAGNYTVPIDTTTTTTTTTTTATSVTSTTTTTASSVTSTTTTTTDIRKSSLLGDADGNDVVDGRDASLVLTHYAMTSTGKDGIIADEQYLINANYDLNDVIDGRDASAILTYYAQQSVQVKA